MAAPIPPPLTLPGARLAAAIRAREVSAVEVMAATLDHIERVNSRVNAIVSLRPREALLAEAAERDAALARDPSACGPLHGLPHAVKDLEPVAGLPFTQGSPIFAGRIAAADSLMVERLRAAGVVFIGKTNTPEWGLGSHTYNPVFGATKNAWAQERSAGGSSGGAAVALALRMTPLADGGDYGGSLRNPAGWNNVFGFRTSLGRVPNHMPGVHAPVEWLPSLGVAGPMARNVGDLALLLSVQAGWDARAPLSMESGGEAFGAPFRAELEKDPAAFSRGKRIGWLGDFGGFAPHEGGVLEVCRGALKRLETLGAVVEDAAVDFPLEKAWRAFVTIRHWQAGWGLSPLAADPARRVQMKPEALWEIDEGAKLSAYEVMAASAVRSAWAAAFARLFARYDFVMAPTAQVFPFPVEWHWPREIAGQAMGSYHEWMKAVCLVSLSGCPSLAAPAGFGEGEAGEILPMGIQIIGPAHGELACLRMAAAYEAASEDLLSRLPPILDPQMAAD